MRNILVALLIIAGILTLGAAEQKDTKKPAGGAPAPEPALVAPQPTASAEATAVKPAETSAEATATTPVEPPAEATPPAEEKKEEEKKAEEPAKEEPKPVTPPAEPIPEKPSWEDPAPYGSVGIGLGMFYGFFGLNVDVHPLQKRWFNGITITASIGETPIGQFAYAGGLRYFLLPRDYGWRPRITIMYGINAVTDYNLAIITDTGAINFREKKTFHGLNLGFGVQYMFGKDRRHVLDFDLVVIAYSSVNEHIDKLRKDPDIAPYVSKEDKPFPLVLSFGYRLAF